MASQPTPDDILLETLRLASEYGPTEAARMMGVSRTTYQSRLAKAKERFQENTRPRVLLIDIETKPAIVHAWGLFDQNIGLSQVVDPGGTICFGAQWLGEREAIFHADWIDGHEEMVKAAHRLFNEADAIITYNGDRFDIPKLRGEFLTANLPPPKPITSIDVYKTVKKLGLLSNKLAFVGPLLTGDGKIKHEGHELWTKVMAGEPDAQKKMQEYCAQDVALLANVYLRVMAYIPNHPSLGMRGRDYCGACGSSRLEAVGYRRTKASIIGQLRCQSCGSWQDGKREAA